MQMYRSKIKIGDSDKVAVVINYKEKEEVKATESITVNSLHHIQLLDRSGSMSGHINRLIENVKLTIRAMADNDYISIIWFSGSGQYKTLIKGARKDDSLYTILDTIKSTLGCTCFSESFEETGDIIKELEAICPNFNITLFTDGDPVVPWSDEEEEKRIFRAIDKFKDKVLSINTIGYGNYYNRDLLYKIAKFSEFGEMIHSSKIDEYLDIFSHNYQRVSDLVRETVEVAADECDILYLTEHGSKMSNNYLKLTALDKRKNQFCIIANDDLTFKINDEVYSSKDIKKPIMDATLENILYGYAYELFYNNRRLECLDILINNVKDKRFIDMHFNSFTRDEIADYQKKLKQAIFKKKYRLMDGVCGENYIPAKDAFCVMDILKLLIDGENYFVYARNYNRIGLKTSDNFDLFKWPEGLIKTPMNELIFNDEKMNISIRNKINGTVQLNPKAAASVNLPKEVKSYIYRNQTVIKDGYVNIPEMEIVVDDETKLAIESKGINGLIMESKNDENGTYLKLNLETIPVINRMYAGDSIDTILDVTYRINKLEAEQKVTKHFLKDFSDDFGKLEKFTPEQINVLEQHGIDKYMMYKGVDLEKSEKNEDDYYYTRTISFDISGFASIPPVNKMIDKMMAGNDLTPIERIMYNQYKKMNNLENEKSAYEKELKKIKKNILELKVTLCSAKIAKILSGDWFENVEYDGKKKDVDIYSYKSEDKKLVIKAGKEKVFF